MLTQQLFRHGRVFWDCSSTTEPLHLIEGEVLAVGLNEIRVRKVRAWKPGPEGFVAHDFPPGQHPFRMRRSYFMTPIEQHLRGARGFWSTLADAGR